MQGGTLEEVLLLERCEVIELRAENRLAVGKEHTRFFLARLVLVPTLTSLLLHCFCPSFLVVSSVPSSDSSRFSLGVLQASTAATLWFSWSAAARPIAPRGSSP